MKKLILAIVLMVSGSCFGAVAHVNSGQGFCTNAARGGDIASTCASATTKAFTYTAIGTGNGVLIGISCAAATTPTLSLAATGWVFTQVGTNVGSATAGWMAVFKAYVPNTSAATITLTSTVNCANFINNLIDEFSGVDATNFVDASNSSTATSATNCGGTGVANVTPTVANDGLWGACNDSVTAVGGGLTAGANDTQQDIAGWKVLVGGSGVAQTFTFTGASGAYTLFTVAIKPSGAAAPTTGFSKEQKLEKFWPQ